MPGYTLRSTTGTHTEVTKRREPEHTCHQEVEQRRIATAKDRCRTSGRTEAKKKVKLEEEWCKDHCNDAHQLQKNVDGRAGGVLEWITDGVTTDSCLVGI